MKHIGKILQALLSLVFLGSGASKLASANEMVDDFDRFRYPQWFRVVTGAAEIGSALGLFAGLFRPLFTPIAGLLLSAMMTGALATHKRIKDPAKKKVPPAVLLGLAVFVTVTGRKMQKGKARAPKRLKTE